MFAPMDIDGEDYYLKPMNCPHHHMIYKNSPKSYKDLPLRLAEYGQCYRYEQSGELFGLMRVRGFCMNDAHLYVTPEQVKDEFIKVIKLHQEYYNLLGIDKVEYRLSLHSKAGLGKKYVDNEPLWIQSEESIRQAMNETGLPYTEAEDEAAFYGPKVDVQIFSAIGKEYTVGTNQLDFSVPEKFGLTYVNNEGEEMTPLCIHRAPLSTHERFIGFLLEHFAGKFPTWLSPVQVVIVPVSDKHLEYAQKVCDKLRAKFVRVEVDSRNESVGKKIRESEKNKIPYMLVLGDTEVEESTVTIRARGNGDQITKTLDTFLNELLTEIQDRKIT
jgi:threonyl-tRNA synthetase